MKLTRLLPATALIAALAVSACGSDDDSSSAKATATAAAGAPKATQTVSVALGWTPNTDYTGVYVADKLGYYAKAGIKLKIIPYASTAPETLISAGRADLGFSYQAGVAYARAAGQDVVGVFSPNAKNTYAIGVKADNAKVASPKDLSGKTYAGFGTPDEGPELSYVIKQDGGTGKFKNVTLNTSAYDAGLQRQGRLHDPGHDLGGRRGQARRQAAQVLQVRGLRLPDPVRVAARLLRQVAAGQRRASPRRSWPPPRRAMSTPPRIPRRARRSWSTPTGAR